MWGWTSRCRMQTRSCRGHRTNRRCLPTGYKPGSIGSAGVDGPDKLDALNPEVSAAGQRGGYSTTGDLSGDPPGEMVAKVSARVEVLAMLKEVRDRSTVNGRTPILSAGLSDHSNCGGAGYGKISRDQCDDSVSASMDFLQYG